MRRDRLHAVEEIWTIQGGADLEEVHAFVACAAEKVGIPRPDPSIREISIPNDLHHEFVRALDECDKEWRDKGLAPS